MIALNAFFARVSDPRFGGVYLTLLNSVNNIGGSWPSTACLWLVEFLTIKSCHDSKVKDLVARIESICAEHLVYGFVL